MFSSNLFRCLVIPLLCVLIAWEWLSPRTAFTPVRAPSVAPQQVQPATVGGQTVSHIETILARPLFSKSRRPLPDDAEQTEGPPRLSGVLIAGANRRAIFENGRKPLVGSVGDEIAAYKIIAIRPRSVTVSGPGGLQIVNLTFNANGPGPLGRFAIVPPSNALERLDQQTPQEVPLPQPPSVQQLLARLHQPQS